MRIKLLREKSGMQQKELAAKLGISPNTLSQYENNKREPGVDIVSAIAKLFGVSIDYVYGLSELTTCPECGLTYCPSESYDFEVHRELHTMWEAAVKKFGKFYTNHGEQEKLKAEARRILSDKNSSINEKIEAELTVLRVLFSRSLCSNNFDTNHVDFYTYIAMLLNQRYYKESIPKEVYDKLTQEYGTLPGIEKGSIYHVKQSKDYLSLYGSEEDELLKYFDVLNDTGRIKAVEQVRNLTYVPKYIEEDDKTESLDVKLLERQNDNFTVIAAHNDNEDPDQYELMMEDAADLLDDDD